jgi:tetratricopeptide (TPR) repeat protein
MRLTFAAILALLLAVSAAPHVAYADSKSGSSSSDDESSNDSGGSSGGATSSSSGSGNSGAGGNASSSNDNDNPPPKRSKTSTWCSQYELWDDKVGRCVRADADGVTDDQRFRAVRELAYHSTPETAWKMLSMMTEGETARYMTYKGFLLRQNGHVEESIATYERAIELDPGNTAARSYYGQLLVLMNELELAEVQLAAIRAHGGDGTWSERSLSKAIRTGVTYHY